MFGELTPSFRLLGGVAMIDGVQEKTAGGINDGKKSGRRARLQRQYRRRVGHPVPARPDADRAGDLHVVAICRRQPISLTLPEWTRVDLGARYTFISPWNGKPIVVRANIENLFNKAYWASAYSGVITLGAPRTYLVSTTFNFDGT